MNYIYRFGDNEIPWLVWLLYVVVTGFALWVYLGELSYYGDPIRALFSMGFLVFGGFWLIVTLSLINMKVQYVKLFDDYLTFRLTFYKKSVNYRDIDFVEFREPFKHQNLSDRQSQSNISLYDTSGKRDRLLLRIPTRTIGPVDEQMKFYRYLLEFNPHIELNKKAHYFMKKHEDRGLDSKGDINES